MRRAASVFRKLKTDCATPSATPLSNQADGRLLACRIEITGRSELHENSRLLGNHCWPKRAPPLWVLGNEAAWIERLVIETEPMLDSGTLRARQDALGELRRSFEAAPEDAHLVGRLQDDIGVLLGRLPLEIRDELEDAPLQEALADDYAALIREAGDYLAARIEEGRE